MFVFTCLEPFTPISKILCTIGGRHASPRHPGSESAFRVEGFLSIRNAEDWFGKASRDARKKSKNVRQGVDVSILFQARYLLESFSMDVEVSKIPLRQAGERLLAMLRAQVEADAYD